MSTLVIHLADPTTDFLRTIYDGSGYQVITGKIGRQELLQAIESHDRIYMLGHGAPSGLFGPGYSIDDDFGPALAKKSDGLYIWCNADQYAIRNKLTGIVSGMFISEVGEAAMYGIHVMQAEIDRSNNLFSKAVREYLDHGHPPEVIRQCYNSATCKVTQFNNKRLYVFRQGIPSPARYEDTDEYNGQRKKQVTHNSEEYERQMRDMEKYRRAIDARLDGVDDAIQQAAAHVRKHPQDLESASYEIYRDADIDALISQASGDVADFAYRYAWETIEERINAGGVDETRMARDIVYTLLTD